MMASSLAVAVAAGCAPATAMAQATKSTQAKTKSDMEVQTISFAPIPDQNALATLNLTATASSGLPVTFSSATPSVCTVAGNKASMVAAGGCSIEAIQAGNAQYAMAAAWQGLSVHHLSQNVTFAQIGDEYAGTNFSLLASASSGLPITFASLTPSVCQIAGNTAIMVAAGGCTLTAQQPGNAVYMQSTVTQGFIVHHANQAITFNPIAAQYVGNPLTLSAFSSSGLPINYVSATLPVCTVSGNTATMIAPGNCELVAAQAGNAAYFPAPKIAQTFTVNALIGDIIGDSIDYCEGATSTATCGTYNILEGLGVPVANINRYARGGAAMEEIANQQINDAVVTPGTITITDGCQNCNQMNLYPAEFLTEQQAMVAMLVDASAIDPSIAGTGLPQKQFATAATLNGTATPSTDYPAKGLTCTSGACLFEWNNVPGSSIYIFVEATTAGSYNPVVTVDGTLYGGNWSSGSALIGYLEPTNNVSHGPWPLLINLPPGANGGSGPHTVTVAVPGNQTVIEVVGVGNSAPAGGPWVIADSQFVWYDTSTTDRVVSNNSAWANAIQEVQQSGLNPVYVDLTPSINGYTAFGATINGAPTRPDLAFTVTNGSLTGISIVPVSIGAVGGGGVCTSNPTIAFFGGGPGATMPTATLTCSGGTVVRATITSPGSGITLPQQFDTQTLHPNDSGHLAIALTTLSQVGNLIP
jgi:hypothetical protein